MRLGKKICGLQRTTGGPKKRRKRKRGAGSRIERGVRGRSKRASAAKIAVRPKRSVGQGGELGKAQNNTPVALGGENKVRGKRKGNRSKKEIVWRTGPAGWRPVECAEKKGGLPRCRRKMS